jgi:hypothetical protein
LFFYDIVELAERKMEEKEGKGKKKKGAQGRQGTHGKKYLIQMERTAKNKEKAWKKHLKKHPTDDKARINIERLRGK